MKKVAIVTPEALAPRSFLWDEVAERFKVKINNVVENSLVQEGDGLCVLGDGSEVVETVNLLERYVFTNDVVELPHLTLEITNNYLEPLRLTSKVNIPTLTLQALINGEIWTTYRYTWGAGQPILIDVGTSCRIAYEYGGSVVVMDVFLALVEGPTHGFVDILINARVEDFPPVEQGLIAPPPPMAS